jgi:hypothetical protein
VLASLAADVIRSSVLTPEAVTSLEHVMICDPRITRGVGGSGHLLGGRWVSSGIRI